jgi:hypothetical protein
MDYAKHTDRRGHIGDVDAFIADEQAERVYQACRQDVDRLLDMLKEEVTHHAEAAAREPGDWGFAGDLGHVRELLTEALAFLAQQDASDIERRLNEERR